MTFLNFLNYVPFLNYPESDRSGATHTDDRRLVSGAVNGSAASPRNHRNDAARGAALMERGLNLSSPSLPPEVLKRVAGFLPKGELNNFRLIDKAFWHGANAHVELRVNNADDLVTALEKYHAANAVDNPRNTDDFGAAPKVYKEGGVTKIILGNAGYPDSGAATFTDEHLALLKDLPFKSVDMSYCHITDDGLANLPPHLQKLSMSECTRITDEGVASLPRGLQALSMSWCTRITDRGLANLPPNLKVLIMSGCTRITDKGVALIPRDAKKLDLSGCLQITDAGVKNIPRDAEEVNLSGCFQITDAGVDHIPDSATWVNLSGCEGVTPAAIEALRTRLAPGSVIVIDDVSCTAHSSISPRQDGLITFNTWTGEGFRS